ncbi:MAG: ATP synthase subunit C family protein [Alphaproteobacteria bacterium]|nr:ATP synthase subunit C family protein [Alphaproteobacteria bacterium]
MEHVANTGIAEAAKYIAAGLCALSMIGAAWGVASIWIAAINNVGRNPSVKGDINVYAWAGFAVTEAIALYALVIAILVIMR